MAAHLFARCFETARFRWPALSKRPLIRSRTDAGWMVHLPRQIIPCRRRCARRAGGSRRARRFHTPSVSVALAALSAQARIAHVIGTTGFSTAEEERIRVAAREADDRQVREMTSASLCSRHRQTRRQGIAGLRCRDRRNASSDEGGSPSVRRCFWPCRSGGRCVDLETHVAPPRTGRTGARKDGSIGFVLPAWRHDGGGAQGDFSLALRACCSRTHRRGSRDFSRGVRSWRQQWARGQKPGSNNNAMWSVSPSSSAQARETALAVC